ncbi:MAG: hypothetical protein ABR506_07180 [Candidatus Krumholzibacteriia bacterium]
MTSIRILAILTLLLGLGAAGAVPAGEFVGIPDQEFATYFRAQRASEWCWASCIEMAMAFAGIDLPQEQVVARTLGVGVNLGGKPADMVNGATGLFRALDGAPIRMAGRHLGGSPSADVLYNHLLRRSPAILLYKRSDGTGHAVLLTGMSVTIDPEHGVMVHSLHVFDPSLGDGAQAVITEMPAAAVEPDPLGPQRNYAAVAGHGGVAIGSAPIDAVVLLESTRLGRWDESRAIEKDTISGSDRR